MVELEKLLSLEEEELEEVHLDWLFTPLEVPENWTEVAGPLVTDPWKVVMGLPLVREAPEDRPEPRIAAAIAELMEGPREPITLATRASSLQPRASHRRGDCRVDGRTKGAHHPCDESVLTSTQ